MYYTVFLFVMYCICIMCFHTLRESGHLELVKRAEVAGALSGGSRRCWLSVWLSVACEQAGGECDMIWGAQGGGSVRNMRGMDEDD